MGPISKRKSANGLRLGEDEELTDDEAYLERHDALEKAEIERYNIGLDKRD